MGRTDRSLANLVLCFGGSFNPIHNGHLQCAIAVGVAKGYERIRLIPSAHPPHKPNAGNIAPASDRVRMCQIAAEYANQHEKSQRINVEVDEIETRREGASYTLDTVRQLRQQGMPRVDWLIGADMLIYLPKWHRPLELLAETNFVIMRRPGFQIEWAALPDEYQHLRDQVVDAPLLDISATEIRQRVKLGKSIDHLTPPPVAQYIAQQGLYRNDRT